MAYQRAVDEQIIATQGLVNHWSSYLRRKYRLGPQDHIGADGVIVRAALPGPPDPNMGGEAS